ncbi:MAG: H-NS histone family protein [Hyphomicrobiaceae bacterium]
MAAPNVDKMNLKELLELEAKVKKAIVAAREREKAEMKHKVESMLAGAGFSLNELYGGRGAGKGKTVAPKYMNPENRSETWTGRGRKPRWLVAKLNKGSKMEDFAI